MASLEVELANANDLLAASRHFESRLAASETDAEVASSAAASVSRLIKSGMTLTQVGTVLLSDALPINSTPHSAKVVLIMLFSYGLESKSSQ